MDELAYRILDTLARNLGNPLSINEVTSKIDDTYGRAHYANTYEKMQEMAKDAIVTLSKSGRSSLVSINFNNYLIIDLLAVMELKRKQDFLGGKHEMQIFLMEIQARLHDFSLIRSVSLMFPERNAKLNKVEIVIHLRKAQREEMTEAKIGIYKIMDSMQKIHNIRVDCITLEDKMLIDFLRSDEANPVREMLSNKIVIFNPQDFWMEIKKASADGIKIIAEKNRIDPAKISEADMIFNLARFGYTELGPKTKHGMATCIEYIINAVIFQNDARRMDAIAVMLAKNPDKANYDLLLFLALKYGFGGRMLGILKALRNLAAHSMKPVEEPIRLLEAMDVEEIKANERSMREKLRLYNVA